MDLEKYIVLLYLVNGNVMQTELLTRIHSDAVTIVEPLTEQEYTDRVNGNKFKKNFIHPGNSNIPNIRQ